MTVWLVFLAHDDFMGAFSTEEKAKAFIQRRVDASRAASPGYDWGHYPPESGWDILEVEVDEGE
jgi:hypothetical protein